MKLIRAYFELGKSRLSLLVVATTLAGYALASHGDVLSTTLAWTLLGTLLSALGANGLNQWAERGRDARMRRTQKRPIPSGALSPEQALWMAGGSAVLGVLILALQVNLLTAGLSALTILLYVLVYTPLKPITPANTLVGALCGALPPVMGWSAATGSLAFGALALGAILFVWQIPHFLGLAWMYREDYASGGFRMLPVVEPSGRLTGLMVLFYSFALLPVALLLTVGQVSGGTYAVGSIVLAALMIVAGWRFYFEPTGQRARTVFLTSLVYMPALITLMIANSLPRQDSAHVGASTSPAPASTIASVLSSPAVAGE